MPPKLAEKLLLFFLREELKEEVQGDLREKFRETVLAKSIRRANINYWYQVFNYMRPFAIRKSSPIYLSQHGMVKNYFKIGFRSLLRSGGYSFINVGGLAVGMAVAMLIGLWVYDEVSFNEYHKNNSRIGQILRTGTLNGETLTTNYLPYPLADEMRREYGESFKHVLMCHPQDDHVLSAGDKKMKKSGVFIEAGGPEMFTLRMEKGTWDGLKDMHSILISSSSAKSLFGAADPMGKLLQIDNKLDVKVTGVYEDLPENTQFYGAAFFASWDLYVTANQWMTTQGYKNNFLNVYVEIVPGTDFQMASSRIHDIVLDKVSDDKEFVAVNPQLFIHPMKKWHLFAEWTNGVNTGGLIQYVWLFGIVGSFVLLLACINFVNLSTARADRRAKEVGIRKAIGSVRRQLIGQFFIESFIVVGLAFFVSLLLAGTSLDLFNQLAGKHMMMPWSKWEFWLAGAGVILFASVLSGSYPALYLSSFQPAKVLKGTFRTGMAASLPRKALVVIQFTVSVTLIIGTTIIYQQIEFAKDRPVGYSRKGLLMIPLNDDYGAKLETLETALKSTGMVEHAAASQSPVTSVWSSNGGFDWRDKDPDLQAEFATLGVTHDYGRTLGWEVLAGRDFSRDMASDSAGLILNEAAARVMGFNDPIDEIVTWQPVWRSDMRFRVLAVVKDMVMLSPFDPPMPTVFFIDNHLNWLNVRIKKEANSADALTAIEEACKKVAPNVPFDYKFADEEYAIKFAAEERIGRLAAVFAVLAIFISCLGLFGLASFVAAQRTKEIGIRKVAGASVFSLWKLLSLDFVLLVIFSSAIAIPLAWYLSANWLQSYAYRMQISWWTFGLAISGAMAITLLTVSYQAIHAAKMNPVRSLRSE